KTTCPIPIRAAHCGRRVPLHQSVDFDVQFGPKLSSLVNTNTMKLIFKSGFSLGLTLILATSASASILTSSLVVNNNPAAPSILQDNSASTAYTVLGAPIVDPTHTIGAGDIITGTLRINNGTTGSATSGGIAPP